MKRLYLSSKNRSVRLGVILALCALPTLSGCELLGLDGGSTPPTQQPTTPPATPPANPAAGADAQAEKDKKAEQEEEYQRPEYPENVRRNPFAPSNEVVMSFLGSPVVDEEATGPQDPLQQYNIAQLDLIGIISEVAVPKAMFVDPEGFGHVVKEGDRIGRQGGTIVDIRDNEVDVREISSSDEDENQSRVTTIRLRAAELRGQEDEELSEAEREALEKLLGTDAGRKALRRNFQDRAAGATAIDGQNGGVLPPGANGGGGVAPPQ